MHGTMNPFLAELYKTAQDLSVDDVEKLAQAEVLDRVLQQHNMSLENLSGADILKVAAHLFGPDNQIAKLAGAPSGTEKKAAKDEPKAETMEEKTAEADYLGRVMAHAFWQEKTAIQKTAGNSTQDPKLQALIAKLGGEMPPQFAAAAEKKEEKGEKNDNKKEEKKEGEEKGEEKSASAIEILAQQRALDMLKQAGIDPTKQKTAGEQMLDQVVQRRAVELLKEAGYQVG